MSKYLTLTRPDGRLVRIVKSAIASWSEDIDDPKLTRIICGGFQKVKESVAVVTEEYDKIAD
jgi:hypothetical protein